jgi:nitrous oxidase accessory protein
VDRSVALVGEGWPVLDGGGDQTVLEITADDVEVRGLRIRGAGSATCARTRRSTWEVRGCVVEDNRLEDNFFGIYLARTRDCRRSRQRAPRLGHARVHLRQRDPPLEREGRDRVEGNRISGHRDGIYLEFAERAGAPRQPVSEDNLRYGLHFMFSNDTEYGQRRSAATAPAWR